MKLLRDTRHLSLDRFSSRRLWKIGSLWWLFPPRPFLLAPTTNGFVESSEANHSFLSICLPDSLRELLVRRVKFA